MLYPKNNIETKIGFDKIRSLLKQKCQSELAKELIDDMNFSAAYDNVCRNVGSVSQMQLLIEEQHPLPLGVVADLREAFAETRIVGTYLLADSLVLVRDNIAMALLINTTLNQLEERFALLKAYARETMDFRVVMRQIDHLIDKFGNIKDNASTTLLDIRRNIAQTQSGLSRTLQSVLKKAQADGLVEVDASPTIRDGRLVLPVLSMNKRKISGIVHDESATGKTVFIEPAAVVEANNRLRELRGEEQREIIRLLIETTSVLRPYYPEILDLSLFVAEMDALAAKAKFAVDIQAVCPIITKNQRQLLWTSARHPILQLSLQEQNRKIVPLDITLTPQNRIVLISGPNAGGKSVCLKTVALLQYMLQCGLPVPMNSDSTMGLFKDIFIDIGDEQSIENDLSTYSSHLLNMKFFLRYANEHSLLLIDEFGTGTEPQIGGAIAEAVLETLHKKKCYGVITTHYTNLKHFATNTPGIVNGAMLFDRQHMQPLFALQIGIPGSSFAIEMARRIGLPNDVIQLASDKIGATHIDYDKSIQDAVRDQHYWQKKREQIKEQEKRIRTKEEEYEEALSQIKQLRKETIQQAKEEASQILRTANATIERTIKDIREGEAQADVVKQARDNIGRLKEELKPEETKQNATPIDNLAVGDSVRIKGNEVVGQVLSLTNREALVAFGSIKSNISLKRLERVSHNQVKQEKKHADGNSTSQLRERQLRFKQQIDIRGMRVDEALDAVAYYVDDAAMIGVSQIRILHGTGTGALRQAVREYLQHVKAVKKFHDEHVQLGGAGITIVHFTDE
ncbi:MAG: Smr/MutS family protein [Bacteroidales bacterium]|nr:Smr/MutS family protein [Bacteroidales bacterium]